MDDEQFEMASIKSYSLKTGVIAFAHSMNALEEPMGIVLDNYQVIENQAIHDGMTLLLNNLPLQKHLIISSRSEPPLPLARLRARDEITELRTNDLQFTFAEALEFFKHIDAYHLSQDQVASLHAQTEGWIEGLCIAAILLRDRSPPERASFIADFTGCNRYVADYLMEEVLSPQPDEMQTFLLQISILDHFNGPLCQAVTEQEHSQTFLEKIEQDNLFIEAMDPVRNWYRYHGFFAELLRHRLHQLYPSQIPGLYQRASKWYEQHNLFGEAIQYALAGHDWDNALQLIDRFSISMPSSRHFIDGSTYPSSNEQDVPTYWIHPDGYLHDILVANPPRSLALSTSIEYRGLGSLTACQTYLCRGQVTNAEQILSSIDMTHPDFDAIGVQFAVMSTLGQVRLLQGRLNLAAVTYAQMMDRATEEPLGPFLFNFYHGLYSLHYEWNQLDSASQNLQALLGKIEQNDESSPWSIQRYVDLAWLLWATEQNQAADDAMTHAAELAKSLNASNYLRKVAAHKARLDLKQNNIDAALSWSNKCRLRPDDDVDYANQDEYLTLCSILIDQDRPEEALPLLVQLYSAAEKYQRKRDVIKILTLKALAHYAQGQHEQALATLAEAVCHAEQEEYIRTFLDGGAPIVKLLQEVQANGVALLFTQKLLAAFEQSSQSSTGLSSTTDKPSAANKGVESQAVLIEPLSPRELEVLRLIAGGKRNREIAEQLTIAASTVKKHVGNILGKLSAKNRTHAVAKAREHGLI